MKEFFTFPVLTLGHFVVDLVCLYFYFINFPQGGMVNLISSALLYNFLAFAMQAPIGYFFDRFPARRSTTIGILFVIGGYCLGLFRLPSLGLLFCSIGNAFYHVGGSIGISRTDKKGLRRSGVFVSSGALGVSLGTALANHRYGQGQNFFDITTAVLLLLITVLLILQAAVVSPDRQNESCLSAKANSSLLLLSLFAIFIRSFGGLFLPSSYKELFTLPDAVPFSMFLIATSSGIVAFSGKFLGGFLSTFFETTLYRFVPAAHLDLRSCNYIFGGITLFLSTILLTFAGHIPFLCFLGVLCFHAAMPVTLFELYCILPDRPGFAMGLSTVMLFLGYLPYVFSPLDTLPKTLILFILSLMAAGCMIVSLLVYRRADKNSKGEPACN